MKLSAKCCLMFVAIVISFLFVACGKKSCYCVAFVEDTPEINIQADFKTAKYNNCKDEYMSMISLSVKEERDLDKETGDTIIISTPANCDISCYEL